MAGLMPRARAAAVMASEEAVLTDEAICEFGILSSEESVRILGAEKGNNISEQVESGTLLCVHSGPYIAGDIVPLLQIRLSIQTVKKSHQIFSKSLLSINVLQISIKSPINICKYLQKESLEQSDRKSTRLNSSHITRSRMPSSA